VELARYRASKPCSRTQPRVARSRTSEARAQDQAEFLAAYESRLTEIVEFLRANRLLTIPPYVGPFQIRQLPEAFKPTSPVAS